MKSYVPIFTSAIVALSIPFIILILARILMRKKPNQIKGEAYECGNPAQQNAHMFRFSIRYYMIAVLFVIFDVETVFLYPWAVTLDKLALFGFIEMVIFLTILIVGYFYAWRKEALQWM